MAEGLHAHIPDLVFLEMQSLKFSVRRFVTFLEDTHEFDSLVTQDCDGEWIHTLNTKIYDQASLRLCCTEGDSQDLLLSLPSFAMDHNARWVTECKMRIQEKEPMKRENIEKGCKEFATQILSIVK